MDLFPWFDVFNQTGHNIVLQASWLQEDWGLIEIVVGKPDARDIAMVLR